MPNWILLIYSHMNEKCMQAYKTGEHEAYTQNELKLRIPENVICKLVIACEATHTLLDIPPLQSNVTLVVKPNMETSSKLSGFSYLQSFHPSSRVSYTLFH